MEKPDIWPVEAVVGEFPQAQVGHRTLGRVYRENDVAAWQTSHGCIQHSRLSVWIELEERPFLALSQISLRLK